jgi:primosomal protein N' (replication factor Y)
MNTFFVDVVLPLHIHGTYTYRVPQEYNDDIQVGQRVVVQFGPRKLYSAVVRRLHEEVPHYRVKYILAILDAKPIVSESLFRFWEWIADYYMCYVGDVMAIALPTAFRLASAVSASASRMPPTQANPEIVASVRTAVIRVSQFRITTALPRVPSSRTVKQ